MDFSAHIEGFDRLASHFEAFTEKARTEIERTLQASMTPVIADAIKAAPVDQGILRASIAANGVQIESTDTEITATVGPGGAAQAYAPAREFGWERTGRGPSGSPILNIAGWVLRHNIGLGIAKPRKTTRGAFQGLKGGALVSQEGLDIAFAIWRKMEAGTAPGNQPHPYMTPAWENHKAEVVRALQGTLDRLAGGG